MTRREAKYAEFAARARLGEPWNTHTRRRNGGWLVQVYFIEHWREFQLNVARVINIQGGVAVQELLARGRGRSFVVSGIWEAYFGNG